MQRCKTLHHVLTALTLFFCLRAPAHAKDATHHWAFTQTPTGTVTFATTNAVGQTSSGSYPISASMPYNNIAAGGTGCSQVQMSETVSLSILCQWVDGTGALANDPPTNPSFLLTFTSAYNGSAAVITGSADDGLGDPSIVEPNGGSSQGKHLIQKNNPGNSFTLNYTLTNTIDALDTTAPYNAVGSVGWGANIVVDDRRINISASIDPTYHRGGPNQPVMNLADSDGNTTSDSWNADGALLAIGYTGVPFGSWPANSTYQWTETTEGQSANGTFGAGVNPDDLNVNYLTTPAPGSADTITIQAQSSDGAQAQNVYTLRFHNKYEDWVQLTKVHHPISSKTNPPGSTDWTEWKEWSNPNTPNMTVTVSFTLTYQETMQGSIGSELVTQLGDPAGYLSFKSNENITSTKQVTETATENTTMSVPIGYTLYVDTAPIYDALTGTCSLWGNNGYQNDPTWSGTRVTTSNAAEQSYIKALQGN